MAAGTERLPDVSRLRDKARTSLERVLNAVSYAVKNTFKSSYLYMLMFNFRGINFQWWAFQILGNFKLGLV